MTNHLRTLLLASLLCLPIAPAQAEGIVADISSRQIEITSGFNGANTTLFGALPEAGDVVLVVTGPADDEVAVRRKEKVFGFWINRSEVRFKNIPGFYWYASSRPLDQIASKNWLQSNRIGIDHQRYTIGTATRSDDVATFQQALLTLRANDKLFTTTAEQAQVMGGILYRADLHLPDTAPVGDYKLDTYFLQRGKLLGSDSITLRLRKSGAMAGISTLAIKEPVIYALLAIGLALFFGWISALLMQRR